MMLCGLASPLVGQAKLLGKLLVLLKSQLVKKKIVASLGMVIHLEYLLRALAGTSEQ